MVTPTVQTKTLRLRKKASSRKCEGQALELSCLSPCSFLREFPFQDPHPHPRRGALLALGWGCSSLARTLHLERARSPLVWEGLTHHRAVSPCCRAVHSHLRGGERRLRCCPKAAPCLAGLPLPWWTDLFPQLLRPETLPRVMNSSQLLSGEQRPWVEEGRGTPPGP